MSEPAREPHFIRLTATSLAGPLIWALHFGAVYGGQHVACATGLLTPGLTRLGVGVATIAAVLAILMVWAHAKRLVTPARPVSADVPAFLEAVTLFLLGLSLFAILAAGLAGILLPACPPLR